MRLAWGMPVLRSDMSKDEMHMSIVGLGGLAIGALIGFGIGVAFMAIGAGLLTICCVEALIRAIRGK